jgi:hypothetical protein
MVYPPVGVSLRAGLAAGGLTGYSQVRKRLRKQQSLEACRASA